MLATKVCNLLRIKHPVVLGGMGAGTNPELVATVSNAGGLGILGCDRYTPADQSNLQQQQRSRHMVLVSDQKARLKTLLLDQATRQQGVLKCGRCPIFNQVSVRFRSGTMLLMET